MNIITKARRYITKYGGVSAAAAKLGMPRSTLYDMVRETATARKKNPIEISAIQPQKPVGQWMQSLHHESAHFITSGSAACQGVNGAKVVAGMQWFPHNGCLRKCQRCMKHAEEVL